MSSASPEPYYKGRRPVAANESLIQVARGRVPQQGVGGGCTRKNDVRKKERPMVLPEENDHGADTSVIGPPPLTGSDREKGVGRIRIITPKMTISHCAQWACGRGSALFKKKGKKRDARGKQGKGEKGVTIQS